jgi:hypothetical protein
MPRRASSLARGGALAFAVWLAPGAVEAQPPYYVALDTAPISAMPALAVFNLISPSASNFANMYVYNFQTTGSIDPLTDTEGGLVSGDLVLGLNPAFYTQIETSFYFNHLGLRYTALGTTTLFAVDFAWFGAGTEYPDAFSFHLLQPDATPLLSTSDPLGAHALFAVENDGGFGSVLTVYDPAMLVGADTIQVGNPTVGVDPHVTGAPRALRFRAVYPNPAPGAATVEFEVPAAHAPAELGVFDIQGRVVARLSTEPLRAGAHTLHWDGSDLNGHRLRSGIYWLRLRGAGGPSVVRRVVLAP